MISDSNSLVGFFADATIGLFGGNTLFLGICVFLLITFLLIMVRAKASTSVMTGVAVAFMFSAVTDTAGSFMWMFWVGIIVSIFLLVMGIANKLKGQ